ncbi:MAG: hypothetical protein RR774_05805, partial [Acinetobacter sp.]
AYATPSAPTPGPSVGHRPVVTGLILGASDVGGIYKGDMTLSSTSLKPGEGISLASAAGGPNGMDVDGDLDKFGAHCVWYRVDNQGVETVVKDPGPNDRNCSYTIQASDAGFKIKNVITIFSDQDVATQKGYTLNPIGSMPVETVSANNVIPSLPFEIIYGPDTRIDISDSGSSYSPPLELHRLLSPADLVEMPGGKFRISFVVKSSEQDVIMNALVLGRCIKNSGFRANVSGYSGIIEVPDPTYGYALSSVATSSSTGKTYQFYSTGINEFLAGTSVTTSPVPMFPSESTDQNDPCSGIRPVLNEKMRVATTFEGYVDVNLEKLLSQPQGAEYIVPLNILTRNSTLDVEPEANISIRVRIL